MAATFFSEVEPWTEQTVLPFRSLIELMPESARTEELDDIVEWLGELIRRGVHYTWYHTYRPVGPKPNFDLALRPDQ